MRVQKEIVISKNMMLKIQQEFASPAVINEKDVNQLRQVILEQGSQRDFTLINLLAYTGIRISEALSIKLFDCNNNSQTKELIIRNGKGTSKGLST
jgi:integrase/recombinase XerD